MPFHGLSAIGYLNLNPIDYTVVFYENRPLVSKDAYKFIAIIDVQIEISNITHPTLSTVVIQRNRLEATSRNVIETVATELFQQHDFEDIHRIAPAVLSALKDRVTDILSKETPYKIVGLTYSARADDDVIEASFVAATRAAALAEKDQIHQRLEQERAEREHLAKQKGQEERQALDADQAGYDRDQKAADEEADHKLQEKAFEANQKQQLATIELETNRAKAEVIAFGIKSDAEADAMAKKLAAAGGDPLALLVLIAPELAAQVLSTQIQQQGQLERAKLTTGRSFVKSEAEASVLKSVLGVRVPHMNLTLDIPNEGNSVSDKSSDGADES